MPEKVSIKALGKILKIAGGEYRILLSGKETDGKMATIEMTVPPGNGPVPHEHPGFAETFYVTSGEVTFITASGKQTVSKGGFVHIPENGEAHHFKNESDETAVLLCTVQPAGLDAFFEEVDAVLHRDPPSGQNKEEIIALAEKFGQTLFPPEYFRSI